MKNANLPKHVIDRLERRWASQLALQPVGWRSERVERSSRRESVDRNCRSNPATIRRRPSVEAVPDRCTA
jgi:hypothetical protein